MERYLTPKEAATRLGISRQYLYDLINNGTLPAIRDVPEGSFKVKVPLKIREADVEALLKKDRRAKVA